MFQPLAVRGFEWMQCSCPAEGLTDFENWRNIPCILELDLEYPKELLDLHNYYILASERLMINKVEKLIPNLNNKEKHVMHFKNLKHYLDLGLRIKMIKRVISFKKEPWLKKYIELNTKLRAIAKNEFEREFFRVMNSFV